ncbi:FAD-dependent oxidoreductase [Jiangella mangrovi]|uniref:Ferredoxin--NADP reductase n=1 Tax=Jiangella mangrovi TaxID=1524084 RepID=A0A7W9GLL9_9ACTN|nr:thioredoxin reductase (NADPH) [Jiangella mangrovi]
MSGDVVSDLLIVGAGPVGLYAAYYAGVRGLTTTVVDSLPETGGQISAMYPEKPIYDVAGFPAVRGRDLVAGLMEQAAEFAPAYLLSRRAETLTRADGAFVVGLDDGVTVRCRAMVITAGIGTFTPRPLPAGTDWLGRGLSYFVPSLQAHAGQDVVVVGGGDSACDWALSLLPIARSVTLVHRRAEFRAHEHTVRQLHASPVEVIRDAEVTGLAGAERLDRVEISVRGSETPLVRRADAVIAALGFTANLGPLRAWGLRLNSNRFIAVDTTMSTGVEGVYAAGDITDYPGKVRLISVGFGEAALAVNNAAVHLAPDQQLFPGHSTDAVPALAGQ